MTTNIRRITFIAQSSNRIAAIVERADGSQNDIGFDDAVATLYDDEDGAIDVVVDSEDLFEVLAHAGICV